MRITKKRYLQSFLIVTVVLAIVRLLFPSIAKDRAAQTVAREKETADSVNVRSEAAQDGQTVAQADAGADTDRVVLEGTYLSKLTPSPMPPLRYPAGVSPFFKSDGSLRRTPIYSVPGYQRTFEDQQDVQLLSASKWGIRPVQNREEAVRRKSGLVFVGSNPYVYIPIEGKTEKNRHIQCYHCLDWRCFCDQTVGFHCLFRCLYCVIWRIYLRNSVYFCQKAGTVRRKRASDCFVLFCLFYDPMRSFYSYRACSYVIGPMVLSFIGRHMCFHCPVEYHGSVYLCTSSENLCL